jgi:hypothetical protein
MSVIGNVFKATNGKISRVEKVDTTFADLNYQRMRNILFQGNTFNNVDAYVANPVDITHTQNSAASRWVLTINTALPFSGWARNVESVIAKTALTNSSGARVMDMPWVQTEQGSSRRQVVFNWGAAVKGAISFRVRVDNPD